MKMDPRPTKHVCLTVILLVSIVCTPVASNTMEEMGNMLRELMSKVDHLTEKLKDQTFDTANIRRRLTEGLEKMDHRMNNQALDISSIRKGLAEQLGSMELKIEWALRDGTLAPKNVSQIFEMTQQNMNDVHEMKDVLNQIPTYNLLSAGVALVDGPDRSKGRLVVTSLGRVLGTVCDDSFDTNAGIIVCKMLGYSITNPQFGNMYGVGVGPIVLDDIRCQGTESSLFACPYRQWGSHDCSHSEDVSINCSP